LSGVKKGLMPPKELSYYGRYDVASSITGCDGNAGIDHLDSAY
jgi:hypothetical protein